jgi:predicted dehydrogenase
MLRIGIAGMGGMGWFHAARYYQIPEVEVVAIADIRPDRLEARNAVQINIENKASLPDLSAVERFTSAEQLIARAQVDVVDICLPSFLHAQHAIRALQAGRHVLCEKPMALSLADADAMIAASKATRSKLMIAQCIRFWPEYKFLKQAVREETYGRLLSLNMYRVGGRPDGWGWENWYMDPARSGSSLFDLHIHDVDFVNSMLGAPEQIQASGRRSSPGSACEIIHALYQYAGGPQVSIHAGWSEVQIPFRAGYEAWFERGFLRLDPERSPSLVVYTGSAQLEEQPADYEAGDAYFNEIQYFLNCVMNDWEPVECPPESARESLVLIERERSSMGNSANDVRTG